jgi:hypothetical protein
MDDQGSTESGKKRIRNRVRSSRITIEYEVVEKKSRNLIEKAR